MKWCQPGVLIRDSLPKVFNGGWSCRRHLSSVYQNSWITGKAGVQHKPYYLHKEFRHSEFSWGVGGNRSKSKPRANPVASLSKDSSLRPAVLTFLHGTQRLLPFWFWDIRKLSLMEFGWPSQGHRGGKANIWNPEVTEDSEKNLRGAGRPSTSIVQSVLSNRTFCNDRILDLHYPVW